MGFQVGGVGRGLISHPRSEDEEGEAVILAIWDCLKTGMRRGLM